MINLVASEKLHFGQRSVQNFQAPRPQPHGSPILQTAPVTPHFLIPQSQLRPAKPQFIQHQPPSVKRYPTPFNVCFACGQPGHWKHSCPYRQKIKGILLIKDISIKPMLKIKGNLARHAEYWKNALKTDSLVLSIIQNGYRIPFRYVPLLYTVTETFP